MARIDKTDSAVGVVRAALAADIDPADYGKVLGVGINSAGRLVKGSGTSGVIGVIIPDRTRRKAGMVTDIFVLGDVVENAGLTAGTKYYADAAGVLSTTNTGTYVGFTVEADRLIVRL